MAGKSGFQSFGKWTWTWSWGPSQIQEIPLVPIRTPRSNFIITKSIPEYHHPQIIACYLCLPARKASSRPYKPLPLSPSVPCLGAPPPTPTTSANSPHLQFRSPRLVTPGYSLSCPVSTIISQFQSQDENTLYSYLRSRSSNLQTLAFKPVPNISPAML